MAEIANNTMNETDKLIEEQLKTLPSNLQQAINAVPWKMLVQEIGKANTLDAEQIVSLEQETMFIVYGFESPNDYVSNVTKNIGVSEDVAYTIAESIAEKIFNPILQKSEELEKSNEKKFEPVTSASVPEIPPVNLPMVEKGEVAHDVKPVETSIPPSPIPPPQSEMKSEQPKEKVPLPDYRYEAGKDPYREPLV